MIENARLRKAALFCLFLLAGGVLSACMKFELQYDFLQYHYYNGFAFWNNRLGVDIAPAFIPTFYNPLLDAVMYALMSVLKQHVTIYCFIQGLWFGALMYLAFKISALYFDLTTRSGKVFACISLLICATGTATWFQMGTATHETELAVLTVGAFYLLLRDKKRFFAADILKDNPSVRAIAYGLHEMSADWNVNRYGKMEELATNVMRGKKKYILMDKLLWLGNDDVTFEAYSWNCHYMKVGDIGLFDGKRFYFFCDKDNEQ